MKPKSYRGRPSTEKQKERATPGDTRSSAKADSRSRTGVADTRSRAGAADTRSRTGSESSRSTFRTDDSCRTGSEDSRSRAKTDGRGRPGSDSSRSTFKSDGRGRAKPENRRSTAKPGSDRGRTRFESSENKVTPRNNRPTLRPDGFNEEINPDLLIGRNPVAEALKAGRTIEKIFVGKGTAGSILKIVGEAKEKGIPIIYTERLGLDRIAGCEQHQGIIAQVSSYTYKTIDDIFSLAKEREEDPLIVVLDNLEDPHNLGAIIRSAEGAGAHGVIIPKRNGVGVTQVVAKASAGAIEYMAVVKVTNIGETLQLLKKKGLWIAACDMGGTEYSSQNLKGPLALVVGSEGAGIGRLIRERCDFIVSIPMKGHVSSLNASNATAILLYEIRKQRDEQKV